jgi:hypothetical protein
MKFVMLFMQADGKDIRTKLPTFVSVKAMLMGCRYWVRRQTTDLEARGSLTQSFFLRRQGIGADIYGRGRRYKDRLGSLGFAGR